jgi:hypothetical protein
LEVSGPTVRVTGEAGAGAARFNVTPLRTPVTVLLVLLIGTPSTTRDAFVPVTALLKVKFVVLPETAISPGTPVVSLTSESRAPFASLITLARTPVF